MPEPEVVCSNRLEHSIHSDAPTTIEPLISTRGNCAVRKEALDKAIMGVGQCAYPSRGEGGNPSRVIPAQAGI